MRLLAALSVLLVGPAVARADGAIEVPATGGPVPRVLYLDRCPQGCTITPGAADDARTDTSSIVSEAHTLTPLPRLDLAWAGLVLCMGELLGPYDLELTTEEPPPDVDYVEVKISGFPEELGLPAGTRGVAPRADDCTPVARGMAFVFGNLWDLTDIVDAPIDQCGHVAHQLGHLLGLDDVAQCRDTMAPGDACAPRSFVDQDVACASGGCACGGDAQNGHARMLATFGAGALRPPPHVELVAPVDDGAVSGAVDVAIDVTPGRPLARLELWVDGALRTTRAIDDGGRHVVTWAPDRDGAVGDHVVEARAYDDLDRMGGAAAAVTWSDDGLCAAGRASPIGLAPVLVALGVLRRRRCPRPGSTR